MTEPNPFKDGAFVSYADRDMKEDPFTVGELIEVLQTWPEDWTIGFQNRTFFRFKQRGEKFVQMEFNEIDGVWSE